MLKIEVKKGNLDRQTRTKIAEMERKYPDDIFVQTFNTLERVSGASFLRLLRINGISIVIEGSRLIIRIRKGCIDRRIRNSEIHSLLRIRV